jgi:uncharacterized membrane protein YbhN (UPF0104 family)
MIGAANRADWVGRLKSALSLAIGLGLFGLSLWVLSRWAADVSLDELRRELAQISGLHVALAIWFTALSFVALVGYEFYAVRYVGRPLPIAVVALYSFITQSVAHAVGFAIFVGATIRYKLYAPAGFTIIDVAKIQVFFTTTFGLGAATLISGVLLLEPGPLADATTLPEIVWRAIGAALLVGVVGFIIFGALFRRPVLIFGHVVALPGAKVTIIQICLGVADLLAVAAALHLLMPAELGLTFAEALGVFVAAVTLGLISHVPGSLGVFESTVILLVQPTEEQTAALIGALIAFRAIYYILPLLCGALALGTVELRRWAIARGQGEDAAAIAPEVTERGRVADRDGA